MRRFLCLAVCAILPLASAPLAWASSSAHTSTIVATTFRLQVPAHLGYNATFWVAYGPLAGKFGLIRLHKIGPQLYGATQRLPAGRTVFAYIAGHGTVKTKAGLQPGGMVTTIRRVGPATPQRASRIEVRWAGPVG